MTKISVYKCESCKKEFLIIDDHSSHCIKCGSTHINVTNTNTNYSLYNHKTGYIVG